MAGRPKGTNNREFGIRIRLTKHEMDILKKVAYDRDMTLASYVRWLIEEDYEKMQRLMHSIR